VRASHAGAAAQAGAITTQGYVPDEGAIPGYAEPDWATNLLEVLKNPSFENVRIRMARILADPSRLTDEAVRVRQALYRNAAIAEVQARFITEYLGGGPDIRKHVVSDALARGIAAPTLVYWGDRNPTPPALGRHIAASVQDGRFRCAEDCGHWAQFESADVFNVVVRGATVSWSATASAMRKTI
jgi:2-hydroxy-6-oxonona-2,4-dienedioate hydrolase